MKKLLLCMLALTIGFAGYTQNKPVFIGDVKIATQPSPERIGWEPMKAAPITSATAPAPYDHTRGVNFINVIDIGTSANGYGYGYYGGQKSLVCADNNLGIVTNFHRMGGSLDPGGYSGDLGYDVSFDGGMTWTNMVECYISNISGGEYNIDAGRYPNHGIYNPSGNTDPDMAYVTFFAPILDETNGDSWGGWTYGRARFGDIVDTTKNLEHTNPPYYLYIPDAYDVSNEGITIAVDVNQDWTSGSVVYQGNLIVARGEWDEGIEDFVFDKYLLDLPTLDNTRPTHVKFAFGPDGQTGWIAVIADNGENQMIGDLRYYYPIFFKTTDGGLTWSDPINVQLDGPDGLPGVLNYLTDEQIENIFEPPIPARDEIAYTTAFDCDLAVDAWGNPHLAVMIGLGGSDAYSIVTNEEYFAAFDIFSTDGGMTWDGYMCGKAKNFRGLFPDNTFGEDNRIQIASTMDGTKMFVTWIDTHLEGAEENNAPDIFARGIEVNMPPTAWRYTVNEDGLDAATNVTAFSEAMWRAYFFATSRFVLEEDGAYTIPMVYMENPGTTGYDPTLAVQFKYIQDFSYSEADFMIVGVKENKPGNINSVSQNYPNPFSQTSTIQVNLEGKANLSLVVTNLLGQQVMKVERGVVPAGIHQFILDGSKLGSGIYFYTVYAGSEAVTRKMVIE